MDDVRPEVFYGLLDTLCVAEGQGQPESFVDEGRYRRQAKSCHAMDNLLLE
jgi:hypothetical protein